MALSVVTTTPRVSQSGTSLIEVLVTIVILAIGLLGLAGLQARLQLSDVESYQRAQALVLLDDIANRMAVNRANAANYVTGTTSTGILGTQNACPTSTASLAALDKAEWCEALRGAAEFTGGSKSGAMIGANGCIENIATNEYMITVVWQGMSPLTAPPSAVACGVNLYNGASGCTGDLCRRVITTVVNVATLN